MMNEKGLFLLKFRIKFLISLRVFSHGQRHFSLNAYNMIKYVNIVYVE